MPVIRPRAPYMITPHLRQFSLRGEPTPCLYDEVSRTCARLVTLGDGTRVGFEATVVSEGWDPLVRVRVLFGSPKAVVGVVKHVLNVGYEYPDTSLLVEACPGLRVVVEEYPGLRPALNPSMWESLVKAVINQQIPTRLALRITSRLVECLGERVVVSGRALYDFPSPEAVLGAGVERLRGLGLSRRKAEYVISVAEAIVKQGYDLEGVGELPPQEAVEELRKFRGVGPWTAKLAYMAYTGNLNLLLPEDLSVSRGLRLAQCREELLGKVTDYAGLISYLAATLYEHTPRRKGADT